VYIIERKKEEGEGTIRRILNIDSQPYDLRYINRLRYYPRIYILLKYDIVYVKYDLLYNTLELVK